MNTNLNKLTEKFQDADLTDLFDRSMFTNPVVDKRLTTQSPVSPFEYPGKPSQECSGKF